MKTGTPKKQILCPRYPGSDWVRPSRLCWRDILLLPIGFRPYRCMICFRRFHFLGQRWDDTKAALQGVVLTRNEFGPG
jgi:hypothetical protein